MRGSTWRRGKLQCLPMSDRTPRSGRCAIVGKSNVGKSTLLNTLLGQKLAIATPKPQTTRTCILGVYVAERPPTQIAFVDTPGFHRPRNALGRQLVESAKGGLVEAEVVLLVTEVGKRLDVESHFAGEHGDALDFVRETSLPTILAINKVDQLGDKRQLLPLIEHCSKRLSFAAIVPISALRGDNIPALVDEIRACLPEGLRYDCEMLTDKPERFFVAELVREAAIRQTHHELPYSIAVYVEQFRQEPRITRISATVVVDREAHKGMVIGKQGQRLKSIGSAARREIELLLGRKVFLQLWVKVVEGWTTDPGKLQQLEHRTG